MVRKALTAYAGMFRVADDPRLAIEQMKVLSQQLPILYMVGAFNAVVVNFVYIDIAPVQLTLVPLSIVVPLCAIRAIRWWRLKRRTIEAQYAKRSLQSTRAFACLVSVAFPVWGIALSQYGDEAAKLYVVFFLTNGLVACTFCLTCLQSAAAMTSLCVVPVEIWFCLTGSKVVALMAIGCLPIDGVAIFMMVIYSRDFADRVRDQEALERLGRENGSLANLDMLTGLPNRRNFFAKLEAAAADAAWLQTAFSVGMIDLDGFKPVNDTYGHAAGDAVLRMVAERMKHIVEDAGSVARLGGDEFGLIVKAGTDLDELGRSICDALRQPYELPTGMAEIGASIGFATFPDAGVEPLRLCECADHALYHAKAARRGTTVMYRPEHETSLRNLGIIEQTLRHADLEAEFDLVYQPLVDSRDDVIGFEALARWTSPRLGSVSPAQFIDVAERAGLINGLTEVLLAKALSAATAWPDHIRLSFNLSTHDIVSPAAIASITSRLLASAMPPSRIEFEVTETAMMRDFEAAHQGLCVLKALGASIALDDFGTGYSSLSYVHKLPIDTLKIDRAFITGITNSDGCPDIVKSVIDLCRNLKIACVAEGVETAEQRSILRGLGSPIMQGYLFGKPMAGADVPLYLESRSQLRSSAA